MYFKMNLKRENLERVTLFLIPLLHEVSVQEDYSTARRYVLNLQDLNWYEAYDYCQDTGGNLAKIYDIATIPDLNISQSLTGTDGLFWIGLSWSETTNWLWSDNTTITWKNWETSEDNVSSRKRKCTFANIKYPFKWRVDSCYKKMPSMCQYQGENCTFIMYPNTSITGHNSMYLYEKTVEECKDTCLTATNFLCVSFEHHPGGRICQFNTGNRWTLPYYFANYEGWNYYQRTCNAGEVITTNLTISTSSSLLPSSTSSYFTSYMPSSSVTYATPCSPLYQEVNVTVIMTTTVYSTITLTNLMSLSVANDSVDPVEELQEIQEVLKERKKHRAKISYEDKRPSATYVGYVAIAFLSCVFGSIILIDLLTICRNTKVKKNKRTQSKNYDVLEACISKTRCQVKDKNNRARLYETNTFERNRIEELSVGQSSHIALTWQNEKPIKFGLEESQFMEINHRKTAIPGQKQRQLWTKLWNLQKSKTDNSDAGVNRTVEELQDSDIVDK